MARRKGGRRGKSFPHAHGNHGTERKRGGKGKIRTTMSTPFSRMGRGKSR